MKKGAAWLPFLLHICLGEDSIHVLVVYLCE